MTNEMSRLDALTVLMVDALNLAPQPIKNKCLIRVYHGGEGSVQIGPFTVAMDQLKFEMKQTYNIDLEVEMIGPEHIGKHQWGPDDLIDWLLKAHIHYIISHIHQGLDTKQYMNWNKLFMLKQLSRLQWHRGFPNGEQVTFNKIYINVRNGLI